MTRLVRSEQDFVVVSHEPRQLYVVKVGRTTLSLDTPHVSKKRDIGFRKLHPIVKTERLGRTFGHNYLSRIEVADIAVSEDERRRGLSVRFDKVEDALSWLHEDRD